MGENTDEKTETKQNRKKYVNVYDYGISFKQIRCTYVDLIWNENVEIMVEYNSYDRNYTSTYTKAVLVIEKKNDVWRPALLIKSRRTKIVEKGV